MSEPLKYERVAELETVSDCLASIAVSLTILQSEMNRTCINAELGKIHAAVGQIEEILGLAKKHDLLMELTGLLEEHPDGWEGDCICPDCLRNE